MKYSHLQSYSSYTAALFLGSAAFAAEPTTNPSAPQNGAESSKVVGVKLSNPVHTSKASLLVGKDVKNFQGETLGKITDMIVDLESGRLIVVVISSGGFLGIGNELSIVPPSALRLVDGGNELQLDVTKETLRKAPHFKSGEWPDLSEAGYLGAVYSAYHVEDSALGHNEEYAEKLNPVDQSNRPSDIGLTAEIRKAILARDGFSVNAQNVKIITDNGHVTLRGPVNSSEEKRIIQEVASKIAGNDKIHDQLEVKY